MLLDSIFSGLLENKEITIPTNAEIGREGERVNGKDKEQSRFVTWVKQARNLHEVSFDQLYAYLKQNELDVNEVRAMKARFPDPLALIANTYNPPPFYSSYKSLYNPQVLVVSKPSVVNDKPEKIVPKQLPKTSKAKTFFKKAKKQLDTFDKLIKEKTTINVLNWGDFGVHHVKRAYDSYVKPLVAELRDSLTKFEQEFHKEVFEMKEIFKGIKTNVNTYFGEKKYFEIEKKPLLVENDRLLEESMSCDIICTILRSFKEFDTFSQLSCMFIDKCVNCESLETELFNQKENVENKSFNELSKRFANLRNILFLFNDLQNKSFKLRAQLQAKFSE
ncbi:hypothetical protein Tco_1029747 [Tanacetum coccineum]|uniref:Uncharacterized protein n=1 Tax=Tanacetum coccineum TaxID=301880 RepID=A0ABQ5G4J4_9ASTR